MSSCHVRFCLCNHLVHACPGIGNHLMREQFASSLQQDCKKFSNFLQSCCLASHCNQELLDTRCTCRPFTFIQCPHQPKVTVTRVALSWSATCLCAPNQDKGNPGPAQNSEHGSGLQVWAGAMDGKVYVYEASSTGELSNVRILSHESMKSGVRCLVESNGAVYSGAEDGRIASWELRAETFRASAPAHSNIVSALCAVGDLVRSYHMDRNCPR